MKTFECYFNGRKVGAIGVFGDFIETVQAETEESARLKIYDTHEHISNWFCREIPPGLAPRLPRNPDTLWGFEKGSKVSLWEQVKAAGIEHDHHETDLYLPVNEATQKLVDAYEFKCNVTRFRSQIDGKQWFDIPFAYLPAWPGNQS